MSQAVNIFNQAVNIFILRKDSEFQIGETFLIMVDRPINRHNQSPEGGSFAGRICFIQSYTVLRDYDEERKKDIRPRTGIFKYFQNSKLRVES